MHSSEELNQLTWHTEERLFGGLKSDRPQVPMWLDLKDKYQFELKLVEVCGDKLWEDLYQLRIEIERAFDILDPAEIRGFITEIQELTGSFPAKWYIAEINQAQVGSIGLVEFKKDGVTYGRLLDVDIIPRYQGRGFGNQLIYAICGLAVSKGYTGLCLKTDTDRWVKDWYQKLGFMKVGLWKPK